MSATTVYTMQQRDCMACVRGGGQEAWYARAERSRSQVSPT